MIKLDLKCTDIDSLLKEIEDLQELLPISSLIYFESLFLLDFSNKEEEND